MTVVKGTFYGLVRRTAYDAWRGPDYAEHEAKDDEDPYPGGLCVLRLALRKGETARPRIESRAVYAVLGGDDPQDALLRAMYWDNQAIRHTTHSTPLDTPFQIAARFVQMPLGLLEQWIALLEHLPVTVETGKRADDTLPICSLRVATSLVTSVFEKTWQVVEGEQEELDRVWREIWRQMGQTLEVSPGVTDVKESFWNVAVKPDVYDLQAYQPTLDLP